MQTCKPMRQNPVNSQQNATIHNKYAMPEYRQAIKNQSITISEGYMNK